MRLKSLVIITALKVKIMSHDYETQVQIIKAQVIIVANTEIMTAKTIMTYVNITS